MRSRGGLRGAQLLALLASASATAIPPSQIFARQAATCPSDFSACPSFPSSFCCPTQHACISLAGGTTLLCCPQGADCSKIKTILCDISLQDAAKNPRAAVKTTALGSVLPKCGDGCCPFGYSCSEGKGECLKDKEQKAPPPGTSTTATPSASATSTSVSSQTTVLPPPTATNDVLPPGTVNPAAGEIEQNQTGSGPSVAVIGGVVGGAIAAIALAVVVACLLVKRRKKKEAETPSLKVTRSSSSFGNIISNPIMAQGMMGRTEFNRRASRSFEGSTLDGAAALNRKSLSSRGSASSRTRNLTGNGLLRHSSIAYGYNPADLPTPPPPRTPRQGQGQGDREPSSVSINVFADPLTLTPESARHAARGGKRNSDMTTFTQLMDEADLGAVARGQAYVPYRPPTSGDESPARR